MLFKRHVYLNLTAPVYLNTELNATVCNLNGDQTISDGIVRFKMFPVSTKCSIIDFRTGTGRPLWTTRNNFGFFGRLKKYKTIKYFKLNTHQTQVVA